MGCFPACFRHLRHKETMKNVPDQCLSPSHEAAKLLPASTESLKEEEIVDTRKLISESEGKCEEQMNKIDKEKAIFDHSKYKKCTNEVTNINGDDNLVENKDDGLELKLSNSANSGTNDFLISDKDCVAVKSKEITLQHCPVEEESSESLFSLSIDSRKQEMGDKEVTSPLKMKNTQLKYDEDKENVRKDLITKQSIDESNDRHRFKKMGSEVAVETSLSSWLVESEKSPKKTSIGNSPESEKNYGEREILGAITSHAEFKELNECSSGGSTPCCSADDQLGIGTVGRYWRRRGRAGVVVTGSGSTCRGVCTEV